MYTQYSSFISTSPGPSKQEGLTLTLTHGSCFSKLSSQEVWGGGYIIVPLLVFHTSFWDGDSFLAQTPTPLNLGHNCVSTGPAGAYL